MKPVSNGDVGGSREICKTESGRNGDVDPFQNRCPELPFQVSIAKAFVRVDLSPNPGRHPLFSIGSGLAQYHPAELIFGKDAKISTKIEVLEGKIPLALQSLLVFHDVEVDGPLSFNFTPDRLSIGDYGGLHLITQTTPTVHCLFNAPMAPRPALGHDIPTEFDDLSELVYANFPQDPRIDLDWTQNVPQEFLEKNGRFPTAYAVEDLLVRLRRFFNKLTDSSEPFSLDILKAGEILNFSIEQLDDFYQPGVIDLGSSSLAGTGLLTPDKKIQIQIPEIHLQLEAMEYPILPLEGGRLDNSNTPQVIDGMLVPGGIQIHFDPKVKTGELKANLDLNVGVKVPLLGALQLSGKLLARINFSSGTDGLRLEPKGSYLQLKDLVVAKAGHPDLCSPTSTSWSAMTPIVSNRIP